MQLIVVATAVVLAILALLGAVGALAFGDRLFASRLAALSPASATPPAPQALAPRLSRMLEQLGDRLGKGAIDGEKRGPLRARLVQAGVYADRAAEIYYALRVLAALGLGLLAVLGVAALKPANTLIALLVVVAAANLGLFLPNLVLARRIARRVEAMKLGLPDAVDLMVVCVEAGATVASGMQRVAREFQTLHPVLAAEFGITLQQMQAGASRAEALTRLAERAPVDELRALVTTLVQSEALGASLGQTLRVFADEMRRTRFMEAEKKAGELPVKMAFPLVFFILPALMGVIFTPMIIRFIRVLFTVND